MIKVWDIYNIFYAEIKRGSFQKTEKSAGLTKKNRGEHLGNYIMKIRFKCSYIFRCR